MVLIVYTTADKTINELECCFKKLRIYNMYIVHAYLHFF